MAPTITVPIILLIIAAAKIGKGAIPQRRQKAESRNQKLEIGRVRLRIDLMLARVPSEASTLRVVNFGCGDSATPGCLNIDGSLTVLLARLPVPARLFGPRQDFVRAIRSKGIKWCTARRLKLKAESIDGFYASHVLEHLSRRDAASLLTRVLLWLRPGGVLRLVLPDLRQAAGLYIKGDLKTDEFVERTGLAIDSRPWWSVIFGHSCHRWMYDSERIVEMLAQIGYLNIEICSFGVSRLAPLGALDIQARRQESLYVEGIR